MSQVADNATGGQTVIKHGIEVVKASSGGTVDSYVIHYEDRLRLPYLPDSFARGTALFGFPGVAVAGSGHLVNDRLELTGSSGEFLPDDPIKKTGQCYENRPESGV
jgi:hypothetical protein